MEDGHLECERALFVAGPCKAWTAHIAREGESSKMLPSIPDVVQLAV